MTSDGDGPVAERRAGPSEILGAGNGIRTRDPQLGKLMLYQLSYSRVGEDSGMGCEGRQGRPPRLGAERQRTRSSPFIVGWKRQA